MLSCIATISVNGPLRTKLRAIADAGFEHVEIFESDLLASPEPVHVIGAMMRDLGLTCVAFQPFRDFEGMPRELRSRVFDRAERKFDVLQELGTDLMLVSSNVSPDALADRGRIVDDFRELGERAAARGLRVASRRWPGRRHIRDHRDAWEIVRQVDHPAVGLALDAFSSLAPGIPIDSLNAIRRDKLFHVQIADAPKLAMDPLSWSRHFRCMPGQGDLPLVEYVSALQPIGYDGVLSLEIFNDRFRAGSTAEVALDGMRSLDYLLRAGGAHAGPDSRTVCKGIEFIEFCASEEEAEQLGQMLACWDSSRPIGTFARRSRAGARATSTWSSIASRMVLRTPLTPCMALRCARLVCASPIRMRPCAARASCRCQSFSQPVGPGEYEIPALRGVGGSLLYFMKESETPSIWRPSSRHCRWIASRVDAGLERIDHFSQSMQFEEMLSWLLYYVTLFAGRKERGNRDRRPGGSGAEPGDPVERSQLSHTAQQLGRRARRSWIAFCTPMAAPASSTCLSPRGTSLPPPRGCARSAWNPCRSPRTTITISARALASRTRFSPAWRSSTSCTTRTRRGTYHHLYTRAFAKRFFFEVVQRHGYDGYGARDTAIRLAAQSRFRNLAPGTDLPPLHSVSDLLSRAMSLRGGTADGEPKKKAPATDRG